MGLRKVQCLQFQVEEKLGTAADPLCTGGVGALKQLDRD